MATNISHNVLPTTYEATSNRRSQKDGRGMELDASKLQGAAIFLPLLMVAGLDPKGEGAGGVDASNRPDDGSRPRDFTLAPRIAAVRPPGTELANLPGVSPAPPRPFDDTLHNGKRLAVPGGWTDIDGGGAETAVAEAPGGPGGLREGRDPKAVPVNTNEPRLSALDFAELSLRQIRVRRDIGVQSGASIKASPSEAASARPDEAVTIKDLAGALVEGDAGTPPENGQGRAFATNERGPVEAEVSGAGARTPPVLHSGSVLESFHSLSGVLLDLFSTDARPAPGYAVATKSETSSSLPVPNEVPTRIAGTVINQLDFVMTPNELGTLQVKLRLSQDTLDVRIEASTEKTLAMIIREHGALGERLTAALPQNAVTVTSSLLSSMIFPEADNAHGSPFSRSEFDRDRKSEADHNQRRQVAKVDLRDANRGADDFGLGGDGLRYV